ncbi:MAG: zinc ribbon domain-containing protein [Lentisphaeria bacterium]|jgi:putative FmdB family regulatory protein
MPIYEYRCAACGHEFEKLIMRPADLPERCPACGAATLRKQWSAFAAKVAPAGAGGCKLAESCPAAGAARNGGGGCCGGLCHGH